MPIPWDQSAHLLQLEARKYGGMEVSELRRIKELEGEHTKLKRMYADLAMENHALKELIARFAYHL